MFSPSCAGLEAGDGFEHQLRDVDDLDAFALRLASWRAVTPSVSMTRQNGQPVAIFFGLVAERFVDAVDVDALADVLFHPHASTTGTTAHGPFAVTRHFVRAWSPRRPSAHAGAS